MARSKKCPGCGETMPESPQPKVLPFCSKRCKMEDLGRWLGADYRISTPTGWGQTTQPHEENDD